MKRHVLSSGPGVWPELQSAWRRLLAETDEPSAFLSDVWIETWLESFAERLGTVGVVWHDGGEEPIGAALISHGTGRYGPFSVSRSSLNASGAVEVGCDHNDVLASPPHRQDVVDDLAELLLMRGEDEIALHGVRGRLFEELSARWPVAEWKGHDSESPYVDLEAVRASGGEYLSHVSSNTRAKIRRSMRIYESTFGPLRLELAGDQESASAWFRELVVLHEETWEARGEAGVFRGDARQFHDALLARAVGRNGNDELRADIMRLKAGDETVGLLYNLIYRGRVSFYQSGLRYLDDRRVKPGLVTHALAIEHYRAEGAKEYDFLGGEPEPVQYKRSLATDCRTLYWAQLPAETAKMRVLGTMRQVKRSRDRRV